jgi:hypothetical protein
MRVRKRRLVEMNAIFNIQDHLYPSHISFIMPPLNDFSPY